MSTDIYSYEKRKEVMGTVKSKNTKPEILLRSRLHKEGYRFRLCLKNLPGTPDIVMAKYKVVIFVNGCFWHQHPGCKKATIPKQNHTFWEEKLLKNKERDEKNVKQLETMGWEVIVIWECEIKRNMDKVMSIIKEHLY